MKRETILKFFQFLEKEEERKPSEHISTIYLPEFLSEKPRRFRSLWLRGASGIRLAEGIEVDRVLSVEGSTITSLPDDLTVGSLLNIRDTKIQDIPVNLNIKDILVHGTPLSEKYTMEEIKKMIEDRGGYIGGDIYI